MIDFLLEFSPILICIPFVIYKIYLENKKSEPATVKSSDGNENVPPMVFAEVFPKVESAQTVDKPVKAATKKNVSKSSETKMKFKQEALPGLEKYITQEKEEKEIKIHSVNASDKVSIKTKSEAKRAFLYSEIFNRKY